MPAKLLVGKCKKCGEVIKIDMGIRDQDEVIAKVRAWDGYECPGHHVEISGSPYPSFWAMDTWHIEIVDSLPTEEEWLEAMRRDYEVRDTDGMAGLITAFSYGFPMTNDGRNWDFTRSPSGKRYYYAAKKEEVKEDA